MVATEPITGKPVYFRIKALFEIGASESWQTITENSVTENVWESLAAECRAKRAFANHTGMISPQMGGPVIPHKTPPNTSHLSNSPFAESAHQNSPFHRGQSTGRGGQIWMDPFKIHKGEMLKSLFNGFIGPYKALSCLASLKAF